MRLHFCKVAARLSRQMHNTLPFILCGVLLMAGCGGSDSASNGNSGAQPKSGTGAKRSKIAPCSLLTKAEAEKVLGETASDGSTNEKDLGATGGILSVCSYSAAKRPAKHTNVSIWQANPNSTTQWSAQTMWANLKNGDKSLSDQRQGGKFGAVSGVGDESYVQSWPAGTTGITELRTLRGDIIVGARVPGQGAAALEQSKNLVRQALERIGP